jgi:putative nucleotidyltransferase with HDIG domain
MMKQRSPSQLLRTIHWVQVYTYIFSLIGGGLVIYSLFHLPENWQGLLLFAGIAALAELMRVELFVSSRFSSVSVSGIIAMASLLALGPTAGVLTHVTAGLMTGITTSLGSQKATTDRASWLRRTSFNIGMWTLSTMAAGQVFMLTGGEFGQITDQMNLIPFILAAGTDVVINLVILIGIISIQTQRNPLKIWQQDFVWTVPITFIGSVVGGGGLALACSQMGGFGVAVFCLPIFMISYAFRMYSSNMQSYVGKLEEANNSLDTVNTSLLETLGAVIDANDIYTFGHSMHVAIYADALAEHMNLPKIEQDLIVKAALIHDIGKIGIPDSIISKQGPLTDAEYEQLKRHTLIGAEIIGRMKGLEQMVPLVRNHHERWDGRGYPDKLAGTDIPLGARVMALADSLDAMCSDRPYRTTRKFEDVEREVLRCAGKQYDPAVVRAFELVVAERGPSFFRNSAAAVDKTLAPMAPQSLELVTRHLKRGMVVDMASGLAQGQTQRVQIESVVV